MPPLPLLLIPRPDKPTIHSSRLVSSLRIPVEDILTAPLPRINGEWGIFCDRVKPWAWQACHLWWLLWKWNLCQRPRAWTTGLIESPVANVFRLHVNFSLFQQPSISFELLLCSMSSSWERITVKLLANWAIHTCSQTLNKQLWTSCEQSQPFDLNQASVSQSSPLRSISPSQSPILLDFTRSSHVFLQSYYYIFLYCCCRADSWPLPIVVLVISGKNEEATCY